MDIVEANPHQWVSDAILQVGVHDFTSALSLSLSLFISFTYSLLITITMLESK
jgi:hypothetical protein